MKAGFLQGRKILITGSTGYLGSTLANRLANTRIDLVLLARQARSWRIDKSAAMLTHMCGDITKAGAWRSALEGVDYVFHLAGLEYDRMNFDHYADLESNFLGVVHMLRCCDEYGYRPKIIFSSSANIAGVNSPIPTSELDPDDPPSLWSLHKHIAEQYLSYYSKHHSLPAISLRLPNLYGPPANTAVYKNVTINKVIFDALAHKRLVLYSNRNCVRDFLHVNDAVEALILAAKHIDKLIVQKHVYVGSDRGVSIEDAWDTIKLAAQDHLGSDIAIQVENKLLEPLDMRSFVANSSAFRSATGWVPHIEFQKGIEQNIRYASKLQGERYEK